MTTALILVVLLSLPASLAGSPWDKAPAQWDLADVYRILQDSPWSPATVKLETKLTSRRLETPTGQVTDPPDHTYVANPPSNLVISRSKPQRAVPVLWWSSKTVRLAHQRLRQLHKSAPLGDLRADDFPDYVLVIGGGEPLRILRDAKEDMHDTVFLEIPGGATLDLASARFVDATDQQDARVEFHFPKQIDGRATLNPASERIVLHCKASAKTPRPGHDNTLFFRAEFKPRTMRAQGLPDL